MLLQTTRILLVFNFICRSLLLFVSKPSMLNVPEFNSWLASSKTRYASLEEYEYRLKVFSQNKELVDNHNRANKGYLLKLNKFAGMSYEEFADAYLMKPELNRSLASAIDPRDVLSQPNIPKRLNWFEMGKVNLPEDQGPCGSCYSFATNAAIESFYAIHASQGDLQLFSKQYMVDCGGIRGLDIFGCEGGTLYDSFRFITRYGTVLEDEYPYQANEGVCRQQHDMFYRLKSFENVKPTVERLAEAISKSPVVLGIEMVPSLRFYKSGIVDTKAPCGFFLNHAVLAVGYDFNDPKPHFIIKNSYGREWGEEGFFKIAMGVPGTYGMCGIAHGSNYRPDQ